MTDFIDSHIPFDFDPERADEWKLPEPRAWSPRASLWTRLLEWVRGLL